MKVLAKRNIPSSPTCLFADEGSIYILKDEKDKFMLILISPEDLSTSDISSFEGSVHPYSDPAVDENMVYIPLQTGQILALDKYSLEPVYLTERDLSFVMSHLSVAGNSLVYLCGIPLADIRRQTTDAYFIRTLEKATGETISKSKMIRGSISSMEANGDFYLVCDRMMTRFRLDNTVEIGGRAGLTPQGSPIVTSTKVAIYGQNGVLQLFNKADLSKAGHLQSDKTISRPYIDEQENGYWFTTTSIYAIDINRCSSVRMSELKKQTMSDPVFWNDRLYASSYDGHVIEFNPYNQQVDFLQLTHGPLSRPYLMENSLVFWCDDTISKVIS